MDLTKLSEEFQTEDIEWRIGSAGKSGEKIWGTCFAYITNRAIMDRLDSVCGAENWKNEFETWQVGTDHGVKCGISIYREMSHEWITKFDGANPTDMEPIKGGFSDSMKRAAVQWGIGRYLYNWESGFVTVVEKGTKGAKHGKLPKKFGEEVFYWLPPNVKAPPPKPEEKKAPTLVKAMETLNQCKDTKSLDITFGAAMKYKWSPEDELALLECKNNIFQRLQ